MTAILRESFSHSDHPSKHNSVEFVLVKRTCIFTTEQMTPQLIGSHKKNLEPPPCLNWYLEPLQEYLEGWLR